MSTRGVDLAGVLDLANRARANVAYLKEGSWGWRWRLNGRCLLAALLLVPTISGCAETGLAGGAAAQTTTETSGAGQPALASEGVVFFLGDGMGVSTVTAGRIYAGQKLGQTGEEHLLSFERFPDVALIKTYNTDMQVPDSAGTMSAITTGMKTRAGVLSILPSVERGDCAAALAAPVVTLMEQMERAGYRTGVVSTATITHATPAANYAHSADRNWESDADMPAAAQTAGCRDIAAQLIEFRADNPGSDGIDVILGGGRAHFIPATEADPEYPDKTGKRADGRDLTAEWLAGGEDRTYVWNTAQLSAAVQRPGQVFGLFEPSHMQFEADRNQTPDGEPSLAEMTAFAIQRLRDLSDGKPYLLVVEAGRIDHAHHFNNAYRAMEDTLALDAAVAQTMVSVGNKALVIVTADHSHTFTVRGPDGETLKDLNGQPYTTLGYANGSSAAKLAAARKGANEALPDLTDEEVMAPDYQQVATVPMRAETHAGEDVAAYATGPGSQAIKGVLEQNRLFDVMSAVLPQLDQN